MCYSTIINLKASYPLGTYNIYFLRLLSTGTKNIIFVKLRKLRGKNLNTDYFCIGLTYNGQLVSIISKTRIQITYIDRFQP